MRFWRRRTRAANVVTFVNGEARAVWAVRAGQLVVKTEYSHGENLMVLQCRGFRNQGAGGMSESRWHWLLTAPFASRRARLRAAWYFGIRRYQYEICMECGRPVSWGTGPTWWSAPDWLWKRIMGGPNGVLCMPCFARHVIRAGYGMHWTMVGGADDD